MKAFNLFLGNEYSVHFDFTAMKFIIYKEDILIEEITEVNYSEFVRILKLQNYLAKTKIVEDGIPADEEVKKLQEH